MHGCLDLADCPRQVEATDHESLSATKGDGYNLGSPKATGFAQAGQSQVDNRRVHHKPQC